MPRVPPAHEEYVDVPGTRLFCRAVGAGMSLLVLHGGPDFNHHYLLPELDRLAESVRLIYYDQRGRGKSSGQVTAEDVTIESEVEDVDRLRRYFGLDAVSLLGHSWGCILAMEYAARHPERTSHVILMNPAPASHREILQFREHRRRTEAELLARMRAIAETKPYRDGDIETEAEYYRLHFGQVVRLPEQRDQIVARLRVHFTPEDIIKARAIEERLYAQTWDRVDYDLVDRLGRYPGPMLVLHGEKDFFALSCARSIAAASGARLVVLEECGHFAYVERPERVHEAIEGFLSGAPR